MTIPSIEQVHDAGAMLNKMRDDLITAERRNVDLEEALREQADGFDTEIVTLRGRLHTAQKQIDDRDARIYFLETEQTLWLQERERFVTIAGLIYDAVGKMQQNIGNAVIDGMQRDRDARTPEPEVTQFDPSVTVTRIGQNELLARVEKDLVSRLAQPEEVLEDESDTAGDQDERPMPAFLKNGPSTAPRE